MTDYRTESTTNWRGLAWAMLPPIGVLLLRAALQAQTDETTASLQALKPATLVTTPGEAMWAAAQPFVFTLVGAALLLAAVILPLRHAVRRHGWPRVRPWVLRAWLAAWLLAAVALGASHLNRSGRQPLAAQDAQVLLVRAVPPTERGAGGAEVYLQILGDDVPRHLLADGLKAEALPPKSAERVQAEAGRWWGRWATLVPLAAPAGAAASAPSLTEQGSGG